MILGFSLLPALLSFLHLTEVNLNRIQLLQEPVPWPDQFLPQRLRGYVFFFFFGGHLLNSPPLPLLLFGWGGRVMDVG